MAKVSPMYGLGRNVDWKARLESLISATGEIVLRLGEEGSGHAAFAVARHAMRLTVEHRQWGLQHNWQTWVRTYGRRVNLNLTVTNGKLDKVIDILAPTVELTDYKTIYKKLERRVYAMFSADMASEIMSRGDDKYNYRQGDV